MAVDLPLDGRFDLGSQIEARCFRLYDRSVDGASFIIREFYPRRLVQADDIEAESIRALHIASASITGDRIVAGTITADLITVDELSAITADMGTLTAGSITGGTIDGAIIYAGSGNEVRLDDDGIKITPGTSASPTILNSLVFQHPSDGASVAIGRLYARRAPSTADDQFSMVRARRDGSHVTSIDLTETLISLLVDAGTAGYSFGTTTATFLADHAVSGGLNVGTATGAATGQVRGSGYLMASGAGALPASAVAALGWDSGATRGLLVSINNGTYQRQDVEASDLRLKYQTTNRIQIDSTGIGAFNVTPVGRQSIGAAAPAGGTGATAGAYDTAAHRDAAITLLNNIRTALINLGWCQT
jgi:hypothetical protein